MASPVLAFVRHRLRRNGWLEIEFENMAGEMVSMDVALSKPAAAMIKKMFRNKWIHSLSPWCHQAEMIRGGYSYSDEMEKQVNSVLVKGKNRGRRQR